eukprot:TRINITY_DN7107_c0_g2_i1.p1 TRINITY_DN7107_c0_g2~~TRINITY_DN7107_c0_g2_i1.p1  ORF type:complete len:117 (-),score=9.01 TRINITY_DN7107_c0_g2_i1:6-356(-)
MRLASLEVMTISHALPSRRTSGLLENVQGMELGKRRVSAYMLEQKVNVGISDGLIQLSVPKHNATDHRFIDQRAGKPIQVGKLVVWQIGSSFQTRETKARRFLQGKHCVKRACLSS